jgi:hypothetical protein
VGGQPAKTRKKGDRMEGLWGGELIPDGDKHGHAASNDGTNASFIREPGGEVVVNDKWSGYDFGSYGEDKYW